MKIALTQMDIAWENPGANERTCSRLAAAAAAAGASLAVFPEFTLTGFSPRPADFCDTPSSPRQFGFFRSLSLAHPSLAVAFGYTRSAPDSFPQNRLAILSNGETLLDYAKIHSYSHGGEDKAYSRGSETASASVGPLRCGAFICYDLRFPEIFQVSADSLHAFVVIGNWPADRIANWHVLLRARALETQCAFFAANRTGSGGGISYSPSSVAYGPDGSRLTPESEEELLLFDYSPSATEAVRSAFPLRRDRRPSLYAALAANRPVSRP